MKTRHRAGQIVAKLRQADVELGKGLKVPEVCKALGISEQTYYRWRTKGISGGRIRSEPVFVFDFRLRSGPNPNPNGAGVPELRRDKSPWQAADGKGSRQDPRYQRGMRNSERGKGKAGGDIIVGVPPTAKR